VVVFDEKCALPIDEEGSEFYLKQVALYISQIFRMMEEIHRVIIVYLHGLMRSTKARMLIKSLVMLSFLHAHGEIAEITDYHISALTDEDFYKDLVIRTEERLEIIEVGEPEWL